MMLQERNSNRPKAGLTAIAVSLLTAIAVFLTGCENTDPSVDPGNTPNPEWTLTVENDPASSMTAVVKVSFTDKEGVLAAFIGDDCCAVTTSVDFVDGLYYLYISPSAQGENVLLKFYSPDLKRVFVAKETFVYVNDGRLGSLSAPYTPTWTVAK